MAVESFIANGLSEGFRGLSRRYREVPFPIDWSFEYESFERVFTLKLFFDPEFVSTRDQEYNLYISSRGIDNPHRFNNLRSNIPTFIAQAYSDYCSRYDLDLLSNVFREFLRTHRTRNFIQIEDRFRSIQAQVLRYHQTPRISRYFSFRDIEEECRFYIPQISLGEIRRSYTDDLGRVRSEALQLDLQRVAENRELFHYPDEPDERIIRDIEEQIRGQVKDCLFFRINPDFFENQAQRIIDIDSVRMARIMERNRPIIERRRQLNRFSERADPIYGGTIGPPPRNVRLDDLMELMRHVQDITGVNELYRSDVSVRPNRAAHERGEKLLRDHLTPEQLKQYNENKWFIVKGSDTGQLYKIKYGHHSNVFLLDKKGRETQGYCFIPAGNLVPGDVMLSQKIELELNENEALKKANKFGHFFDQERFITEEMFHSRRYMGWDVSS